MVKRYVLEAGRSEPERSQHMPHVSRFKMVVVAALALVLVIAGVIWHANTVTASDAPYPPLHAHQFQISDTYVSGSPAITPHLASGMASASANPAFTQSDVVNFLNTHGFFAGPVVSGAHLKILSVQFVTAKRASALMYEEDFGRPDDALVCYVKVQGPFLLTNVHGGSARPNAKPAAPAKYGDAVFDAHTGNLLVWGIYLS